MQSTVNMENRLRALFRNSGEGRRHVRFFAAIPDELVPFMPGFWWNQRELFALEVPAEVVPIDRLDFLLDVPIWRSTAESGLFTVTGRMILDAPQKHTTHWERILAADITYPVVLHQRGNANILLDGYHRLLHSIHQGRDSLLAKITTQEHIQPILELQGFLGELNDISRCSPHFIGVARGVAIELLAKDDPKIFPPWT